MSESNDAMQDSENLAFPQWFQAETERGLLGLQRLRLRGQPTTEAEFNDHIAGVREALWDSRTWDVQRDTPKLREAFRRLAENSDFWPTLAQILARINEQTAYLSAPETRLLLEDAVPVQLGDFGELVREAIRRIPTHLGRVRLLEIVMQDMTRFKPGYSMEARKAERYKAVQQILDMHPVRTE